MRRVSLSAASLASVPELAKKTLPVDRSTSLRSCSTTEEVEQALGEGDLGLGGEEVRDVAERLQLRR